MADCEHWQRRWDLTQSVQGRPPVFVVAYYTAFDVSDRVRAQAELEVAQEALRQSQRRSNA